MVDFLHYGKRPQPKRPAPAKVVVAESTVEVMKEEEIVITPEDTAEVVVEKVNKSNKVHAKKEKNGKVRVKQVLKD